MNELDNLKTVGFIARVTRPITKTAIFCPCGIFVSGSADQLNNTAACLFDALYSEYDPRDWIVDLISIGESQYLQTIQEYEEKFA